MKYLSIYSDSYFLKKEIRKKKIEKSNLFSTNKKRIWISCIASDKSVRTFVRNIRSKKGETNVVTTNVTAEKRGQRRRSPTFSLWTDQIWMPEKNRSKMPVIPRKDWIYPWISSPPFWSEKFISNFMIDHANLYLYISQISCYPFVSVDFIFFLTIWSSCLKNDVNLNVIVIILSYKIFVIFVTYRNKYILSIYEYIYI